MRLHAGGKQGNIIKEKLTAKIQESVFFAYSQYNTFFKFICLYKFMYKFGHSWTEKSNTANIAQNLNFLGHLI